MTGKPGTAVLFDTENLFHPFGYPLSQLDEGRVQRLDRHFPGVPQETALTLGELVVHDVIDWLDNEYERHLSRSYGWPRNSVVKATRETLAERGFTHVEVPSGKDKADEAVKDALELAMIAERTGHATLGGEDHLVLDYAAEAADLLSGYWQFLVIVPDGTSRQVPKFATNGKYGALELETVDGIRQSQKEIRRRNADARSALRRRATRLLQAYSRPTNVPTLQGRFLSAVKAILGLDHQSPGSAERTAAWATKTVSQLVENGLDKLLAQALVAWASELEDVDRRPSPYEVHELLFRATFAVWLNYQVTADIAFALRCFVLMHRLELLTALESAISDYLPTDR